MACRIGYARVSTDDQDLAIQNAALEKDGCVLILDEKKSGTQRDGRDQLQLAMKVLMRGDNLVVTRLDHLGRSLRDLANIAHEIEALGANLRVLEQSVDAATRFSRSSLRETVLRQPPGNSGYRASCQSIGFSRNTTKPRTSSSTLCQRPQPISVE